jgi:hypothetical protein
MKTKYSFFKPASRTLISLLLFSITTLRAPAAAPPSPSELLEQGIYSEETRGDVEAALKLYQQVVAEAKAGQAVGAQAQYRLGVCFYKKKNFTEATVAFEKLIRDYPDQKDLIALANKYLVGAMALLPVPWTDGEEMRLDVKFPTGFKLGTAVWGASAGETNGQKIWQLHHHLFAGVQQISRVEVEADSFRPIHCRWKHTLIGDVDVAYFPGYAELRNVGKEGVKRIDLGNVVYDNEEVVQMMRRLPLAPSYKTTLRVLTGLGGGNILPISVEVSAAEKLDVPAGSFDCYKIELGLVHQTFWYSTDSHHYLVKFEGGGVVGELSEVVQHKSGEPVTYQDPVFNFSLTAPSDWMFHRAEMKDEKTKTQVLALDPDGIGTSFVNVGSRKVLGADEQKSLRAWAEKEIADGEGSKTLKDLQVRPDSWKDRSVAGNPGLSFIGDFMEGKDKKVGYAIFTLGKTNAAVFLLLTKASDFDAFQPKFDALVDSYKAN